MTSADLVISILGEMNEPMRGKTMLQKVIFILSREFPETNELTGLKYTKYYYGPFSRKLEKLVEDGRLRGLLKIVPTPVGSVVRYDIAITETGKHQTRNYISANESIVERMATRARELNAMNLPDVINIAYRLLPQSN
jgi:uncharacterized protein YwgA